jgi:hypothetical protein
MDVFSRTFLPATSQAGLPIPVVSRHMPVVRHCVFPDEQAVLVARCHRPGHPVPGSFLLLLTDRSLVVTRETRLLHRVYLYLAANLKSLRHVTWTADARVRAVELAATTPYGVRERFWIRAPDDRGVRRLDALFSHAFRAEALPLRTASRVPPRPASPAGAL